MNTKNTLAIIEGKELTRPGRLDRNPGAVYLAKLAKGSRRVQLDALNVIADILSPGASYLTIPWGQLEYQHAQAIRAVLSERYSAATANRILSALRETAKQAWLLGAMPADQYLRIAEVENVKGSTLPAGRGVTSGEISALMDVCINDPGPAGFRDGAIIALMAMAGPRRSEVVSLDLKDYDPETGTLRIRGKGNKERETYIDNGALDAMADWLEVRGSEPGPLFIGINKGGNMELRRLTGQAIYHILNKRIDQAGVKDFSPHDLRRTFISDMLEAGADVVLISRMVGHSDPKTTGRYDRRPEQAKKKAAGLLHIPYKRRLNSKKAGQ